MLNPFAKFPTKAKAPDANYTYGSAQDVTTPGDGTGTPWVADLVNDFWGMAQSFLNEAAIVPSGNPDTILASDLYDSITAVSWARANHTGTQTISTLSDHNQANHNSLNINAATLATLAATQFLRSDAADTITGEITIGNGASVMPHFTYKTFAGMGGWSNGFDYHNAAGTKFAGVGASGSGDGVLLAAYMGWGASPQLAANSLQVSSTAFTYKSNAIYHAANHNKALHDALNIDAATLGTRSIGTALNTVPLSNLTENPSLNAGLVGGLRVKIIDIGDWDMDADPAITVAHGLTVSKIRRMAVHIRDDTDANSYNLDTLDVSENPAGRFWRVGSTVINLSRVTGSLFDSTSFDSTSYNRGYMVIDYVD